MKKILLFLFVTGFLVTLFSQTIVSTTPSNRNMILEEFTGKACQYCPDGHKRAQLLMNQYPDRFFAINVHQGSYASGTPNYTTPYGNALATQAGIPGYPAGTVNRQVFSGVSLMTPTNYAYSRDRWGQCAAIGLAQPSSLNVAAVGTLDVSTRHLTLLVEVYYTGNAVESTNKLTVAMLQSEILGPQTGATQYYPEMMVGNLYRHMHMLRDYVTGTQWGMDVTPTTSGSFWSYTFEYDIPKNINNIDVVLEDLEFIVFVAENQQTIITGSKANITYVGLPAVAARIEGVTEIPIVDCYSDADAYIKLRNIGQDPVTSAEIQYSVAGETPNTFVWNKREITSMNSDTIHLPTFKVQPYQNQVVNINLIKINNQPITADPKSITIKKDFVKGDAVMKLVITTDRYCSETTFQIFNPDGTVLLSGGPWPDLTGNGTTVREFDFIPTMDGCHKVEVYDAYGDGINAGYGAGNVKILDNQGNQIYYNNGQFGTKLTATVGVNLNYFTITASAGGHGTISPTGAKEYVEGESVSYIFTPDPGYAVDKVLVDGAPVEFTNNCYTFPAVDKDYTINVTFKGTAYYKITATAGENGTIFPDGEKEFLVGENAEYIFTPNPNYVVDELFVDGVSVGFTNNSYTFLVIDKDYTIHVTFKSTESIKDVNGVTISVAPNPVNDKLMVTGIYDKLEIFSLSGQILTTAYHQPFINVTHLAKGIYFVKIQSNGQICTFKVVK